MKLKQIYRRRLGGDVKFRAKMYKILFKHFFKKYIPKNSVVLDVAAGYCEFINSISARKKIVLDINPDVNTYANKNVEVIISKSTDMSNILNDSVDVAFINNFFEHISKQDIIQTLKEIKRVLKKKGKLLIVQPNIRYCYKDYWRFFDHITPLDDRSIVELLEINEFKIMECKPRFLPYTTKGNLPKSLLLLKIYLRIPLLHRIFGQQAFIYAKKTK